MHDRSICYMAARASVRNEGQLLEMKGNGGDVVSDSVLFKQQLHRIILRQLKMYPVASEEVQKFSFVSSTSSLVFAHQLAACDGWELFPFEGSCFLGTKPQISVLCLNDGIARWGGHRAPLVCCHPTIQSISIAKTCKLMMDFIPMPNIHAVSAPIR